MAGLESILGLEIRIAGDPLVLYSGGRAAGDHDELREPAAASSVFLEGDEEEDPVGQGRALKKSMLP